MVYSVATTPMLVAISAGMAIRSASCMVVLRLAAEAGSRLFSSKRLTYAQVNENRADKTNAEPKRTKLIYEKKSVVRKDI